MDKNRAQKETTRTEGPEAAREATGESALQALEETLFPSAMALLNAVASNDEKAIRRSMEAFSQAGEKLLSSESTGIAPDHPLRQVLVLADRLARDVVGGDGEGLREGLQVLSRTPALGLALERKSPEAVEELLAALDKTVEP